MMVAEVRRLDRRTAIEVAGLEERVARDENVIFVRRVRFLGLKAVYGGEYQPEVATAAGRELVSLADRRLRQLGGDAA